MSMDEILAMWFTLLVLIIGWVFWLITESRIFFITMSGLTALWFYALYFEIRKRQNKNEKQFNLGLELLHSYVDYIILTVDPKYFLNHPSYSLFGTGVSRVFVSISYQRRKGELKMSVPEEIVEAYKRKRAELVKEAIHRMKQS